MLVTFGEAMVRLTPPGFRRLEQATSLEVHVGGGELNVAVGAARLGLAARWVSRLPESPIGRLISGRAAEQTVDVSHIAWTSEGRAGLYFAELGAAPRASSVLYDRAGSAMSLLTPGTIDWPRAFDGTRWFHISGITPALSASAAATTAEALAAARAAGLTVSYDLNYRRKLWTPAQARAVQEPLMRHVDVFITTEEDTRLVFGVDKPRTEAVDATAYEPIARSLQAQFGFKAVAVTLRDNPLVWRNSWTGFVVADGVRHDAPRYDVEIVDRIGAGDAFCAGLIYGASSGAGWARAVQYATALSALKHSIPGDFALVTRKEVEDVMAGGSLRVNR